MSFNVAVFNQHLSWLLVLAGVLVVLAHVPTFARHVRSPGGDFWWRIVWLTTWIAVPYVLLMTGSNQDVRLMAPAFVGIAVALAAGLGTLRPAPLRIGLAVATCAALAFQTANRVVPLGPGWLPATADVHVGDQYLAAPIASSSPWATNASHAATGPLRSSTGSRSAPTWTRRAVPQGPSACWRRTRSSTTTPSATSTSRTTTRS